VIRYGMYPGWTAAASAAIVLFKEGFQERPAARRFGDGLEEILVELHYRHVGPPPQAFSTKNITEWHKYLGTLPKVIVQRKAKRVRILWPLALEAPAHDRHRERERAERPTVAGFEAVGQEMVAALKLLRTRRLPSFDVEGFLTMLHQVFDEVPRGKTAFSKRLKQVHAARQARANATPPDPWAGLDLSQSHPQAREILNDPFYWSLVDDNAPVGNDTGADVLASYRRWAKKPGGGVSAIAFVERLLTRWGMREDGNEQARDIRDEAFIALAFVQLMVGARAETAVVTRALEALSRQAAQHGRCANPKERLAALTKMRALLQSLPT